MVEGVDRKKNFALTGMPKEEVTSQAMSRLSKVFTLCLRISQTK